MILTELCDKACDKILESPIVKWLLKTVQMLACILVVQTFALLWIAASVNAKITRL